MKKIKSENLRIGRAGNKQPVSCSADDIVKMLADWSNRYPRERIYHIASKTVMDNELIEIEEIAKNYVLEHYR